METCKECPPISVHRRIVIDRNYKNKNDIKQEQLPKLSSPVKPKCGSRFCRPALSEKLDLYGVFFSWICTFALQPSAGQSGKQAIRLFCGQVCGRIQTRGTCWMGRRHSSA